MTLGRTFGWLWAGSAAGNAADGIAFVAIPLVAVSLTTDPVLIAGLDLLYAVMRLIFVVPVGVLVDRVGHRSLLWTANILRGGLLVALAAAFALDLGSLPLLYAVFGAIGVLETVADNAALSALPTVVGPADLDRANGRIVATQLVADEFVGPPLGAFLFAVALALPIAVTGGLYAAAGLFFLALPRRQSAVVRATEDRRPSFWREAAHGAAWMRGQRIVGGLALTSGLASIAYMMSFSILVLYATQTLGLSAAGYGILLAVSALGGLLGSALAAPLRRAIGYRRTVPASLALGSATMAGLFFTTNAYLAAALLVAYILHATVWGISSISLRQRLVPDGLRGRANSISKLSGLIGLALGALAGGQLAKAYGLHVPFGVAALAFAGCVAYTAWFLAGADDPSSSPPTS